MTTLARRPLSAETYGIPHNPNAPLFEAADVSVKYDNNIALDGVSFSFTAGEQVAIVGPNGAGKSTLFKLIVGEIRPNAGTVTLYGTTPEQHLCVAYVPQNKNIDWTFPVTVRDVVMMGRVGKIGLFRWARRHDREIVAQSLERVNISHLADKQIGELSGGQQQRVFIARALAQEAELLLLDEPLSGLDIPSQEKVFSVMDSVAEAGITLIVATHDLKMAAERFDRVMLLNKKLIAFGRADEVLSAENLATAYNSHLHTRDGILVADVCQH